MLSVKGLISLSIFVALAQANAFAQVDSVRHQISAFTTLSNTDYLPHYLIYNQQGKFSDKQGNVLFGYNSYVQHEFNDLISIDAGLTILAGNQSAPLRFQELYGKLNIGFISVIGGRFFSQQNIPDVEISTGDLGISRNALPLPKIGLIVEDFTNVPFTHEWVQFKGSYFHGWFEEDRFIESPLLHEKSFYLKAGKEKFRVVAQVGITHFAQWGGEHPTDGNLYNSFRDYFRVIFGEAGDPQTSVNPGEIVNVLGNHIGNWDATITYHFKESELALYYQHPFETKMSFNPFRNNDLLVGLNFKTKQGNKLISSVAYEFLSTMEQRGPGIPDPMPWVPEDNYGYPYGGRNDLYNNYYYTNGWTYRGLVIGNPLLTTYQRLTQIGHDINRHNVEIVNNRVIANHLGIRGAIGNIKYNLLNTLSRNFGTYAGLYDGRFSWEGIFTNPDFEYYYLPPKIQFYSLLLLESDISKSKNVKLNYGIAIDAGDIYNNFGAIVGFKYSFSKGKLD